MHDGDKEPLAAFLAPVAFAAHIGWHRGVALRTIMAASVQVFGCRHDEAIHALRRPASEKRQGTKSRKVEGGGAADAMGIWPGGPSITVALLGDV